MAKFKMSIELTGLKVHIEGSREDIPQMSRAAGQQIAGILMPMAEVVEGEVTEEAPKQPSLFDASSSIGEKPQRKKTTRKRNTQPPSSSGDTVGEVAVDWKHDPEKWGTPQQDWNTADKSLWLLYVVSQELQQSELSSRVIELTFNKHFRTAGKLYLSNIGRDLGKLKMKTPSAISEDTTVSPSKWFLTDTGIKKAQGLIAKLLEQNSDQLGD